MYCDLLAHLIAIHRKFVSPRPAIPPQQRSAFEVNWNRTHLLASSFLSVGMFTMVYCLCHRSNPYHTPQTSVHLNNQPAK
jgi:hypothetical protein